MRFRSSLRDRIPVAEGEPLRRALTRETRLPNGETFGQVLARIEREREQREAVVAAGTLGLFAGLFLGAAATACVVLLGGWLQ